jgi:hypothetical protein
MFLAVQKTPTAMASPTPKAYALTQGSWSEMLLKCTFSQAQVHNLGVWRRTNASIQGRIASANRTLNPERN